MYTSLTVTIFSPMISRPNMFPREGERYSIERLSHYRIVLLLTLIVFSGASLKGGNTAKEPPGVALDINKLSYEAGDTLKVQLVNGSGKYLVIDGYCGARIRVERMVNDVVEFMGMLILEVDTCMGHMISIEPESTQLLHARPDLTRSPGRYRLSVMAMRSDTAIHFNAGRPGSVRPALENGETIYSHWFTVE